MTHAAEFPHIAAESMPAIPATWQDQSWHNDLAPCFIAFAPYGDDTGKVRVWVDHVDPAQRASEAPPQRYRVTRDDPHYGDEYLLASDDWATVLAMVALERTTFRHEPEGEEAKAEHWAEYYLRPLGFLPEVVGGGDVILSRYFGHYGKAQWSILATRTDGGGRPTAADFRFGVYSPDNDGDDPTLEISSPDGFQPDEEEGYRALRDAAARAIAFAAGDEQSRQSLLSQEFGDWMSQPEQTHLAPMGGSADELLFEPNLTDQQRHYLGRFCFRWDECELVNEGGDSDYAVSERSLLQHFNPPADCRD